MVHYILGGRLIWKNALLLIMKEYGAKYTSNRVPVVLVYWELQENQSTAQKREASIKRLPRRKKIELIREFANI